MRKFFKIITILGALFIIGEWVKVLCGLEGSSESTFRTVGVITLISFILWFFYPNQED